MHATDKPLIIKSGPAPISSVKLMTSSVALDAPSEQDGVGTKENPWAVLPAGNN